MLFSQLAILALVPAALADWGNLCSSDRKAKVLIGNGQPGVSGELTFFQSAWSDVVTLTGTVSSLVQESERIGLGHAEVGIC